MNKIDLKKEVENNETKNNDNNKETQVGDKKNDEQLKTKTGTTKEEKANRSKKSKRNKKGKRDKDDSTTKTDIKLDEVKGNAIINNADELKQVFNINENNLPQPFSEKDLHKFDKGQLPSDLKEFLVEDKYFDIAVDLLKSQGILFLIASSKASIFEVSVLIADELSQSNERYNIRFYDSSNKNKRINFNKFLPKLNDNSVVIFNDPLKKQNKDFLELINKLNPSSTVSQKPNFIKEKLNKNIYTILIFSIENNDTVIVDKLKKLNYCQVIESPNVDLKEKYLRSRIEEFEDDRRLRISQEQFNKNIKFLQSNLSYISNELIFIEEITEFTENLKNRLLKNEKLELDINIINDLLSLSKNIKSWLIEDIGKDIQLWSFVLTLTLMSNSPNNSENEINLIDFQYFRSKILSFLIEELNIKNKRKTWSNLIDENNLFTMCRAEKKKIDKGSRLCVSFVGDKYSSEIWKILIEEFSLTLVRLIPFLFEVIDNSRLRKYSAQILGRIGQIDFIRTTNTIREWSQDKNVFKRSLVGNLFTGIHSSSNKAYINKCEKKLYENSINGSYKEIWTSIVAYKQIGLYNHILSLKCFGDIIENNLAEKIDKFNKLANEFSWSYNKLEIFPTVSKRDFIKLLKQSEEVNTNFDDFVESNELVNSIKDSIVVLCLNVEPLSIINEWLKWFDRKNDILDKVFCKMLVSNKGVLNKLSKLNVELSYENNKSESWNLFVLFITNIEDGREIFLELIEKSCLASKKLNSSERQFFTSELTSILANWGKSSVDIKEAKQAIVSFLSEILHKHNELITSFNKYLNQWKINNSLKMKTLATEIENGVEELNVDKKNKPREWDL